jgi:hypothetical protein
MARLRTLPTFLLLALAVLTAVPTQASMRCEMQERASAAGEKARPCKHCKQKPQAQGQSFRAAAVQATCCELRAASPTPPVDVQQRSAHEVQGPQVALAPPPSSATLLVALLRLPAPPAPRQLALASALPLYRPLLR